MRNAWNRLPIYGRASWVLMILGNTINIGRLVIDGPMWMSFVGLVLVGIGILLSLGSLVVTLREHRATNKQLLAELEGEARDLEWKITLIPYPSLSTPPVCEWCGTFHRSINEAIRWHARRMVWLSNRPANEDLFGRRAFVWYRRERDFVESMSLVLPEGEMIPINPDEGP